ncbi:MAG: hypothetical protein LBI20_02555, partial [Holosporales bacterium]|nr:hypothetical protein [Holosporales bacterium]
MINFLSNGLSILTMATTFLVRDIPRAFHHAVDSAVLNRPIPQWTGKEKAKHVILINLDAINPQQWEN